MRLGRGRRRDRERDLVTPVRHPVARVQDHEREVVDGGAALLPTALCGSGHARGDEHEHCDEEECKDRCERFSEHRAYYLLARSPRVFFTGPCSSATNVPPGYVFWE